MDEKKIARQAERLMELMAKKAEQSNDEQQKAALRKDFLKTLDFRESLKKKG